jgi:hypothetical protein
MDMLYIIDKTEKFTGSVINTMPFVNVNTRYGADILLHTYVHNSTSDTFGKMQEEYKGNLIAITWEQLYENYVRPYLIEMQEDFVETTEENFNDMLECVPPKRFTYSRGGKYSYFFVGECYTYDLYQCYVRKDGKYYTALRSITTTEEDILNLKPVI